MEKCLICNEKIEDGNGKRYKGGKVHRDCFGQIGLFKFREVYE